MQKWFNVQCKSTSEELNKTLRAINVAWSEHYVKLLMERNERERQGILRRHKL